MNDGCVVWRLDVGTLEDGNHDGGNGGGSSKGGGCRSSLVFRFSSGQSLCHCSTFHPIPFHNHTVETSLTHV